MFAILLKIKREANTQSYSLLLHICFCLTDSRHRNLSTLAEVKYNYMEFFGINWNENHILKTNTKVVCTSDDEEIKTDELKKDVEPWLSAIFQSEHLSLLVGTGLTSAVSFIADVTPQEMIRLDLADGLSASIKKKADETATKMKRGGANIEDDIRIALELINGLKIIEDARHTNLEKELDTKLLAFIRTILKTEKDFFLKLKADDGKAITAFNLLKSFILSLQVEQPQENV